MSSWQGRDKKVTMPRLQKLKKKKKKKKRMSSGFYIAVRL